MPIDPNSCNKSSWSIQSNFCPDFHICFSSFLINVVLPIPGGPKITSPFSCRLYFLSYFSYTFEPLLNLNVALDEPPFKVYGYIFFFVFFFVFFVVCVFV